MIIPMWLAKTIAWSGIALILFALVDVAMSKKVSGTFFDAHVKKVPDTFFAVYGS